MGCIKVNAEGTEQPKIKNLSLFTHPEAIPLIQYAVIVFGGTQKNMLKNHYAALAMQ